MAFWKGWGLLDHLITGTRYISASVADQVLHWGISGVTAKPSLRLDHQFHANKSYNYMELDASTDEFQPRGTMRLSRHNVLSRRYELRWVAGQRGLVTVNASVLFSTDHDFEVLGTNAVAGSVTANPEGGLIFTTAGASNDQVILVPYLATAVSPWKTNTWGTDQQTEWECDISTDTLITTLIIWAGLKLTNTSTTTTDNDQVFFRFQPSVSAFWQTTYSIGNTDVTADTTVTVAASTRYHLAIKIDSSRIPTFFINGVLMATGTALTNATDFIPYIGVQGTTGARLLNLHGQAISRKIGA